MKLRKITYTTLALILLMLLGSVDEVSAQYYRRNSYRFTDGLSVSVQFGPTIFAGDLGVTMFDKPESAALKEKGYVGISGGIGFEKEIKEYVNVGLNFNYGQLQGSRQSVDASHPYIKFESNIYEISLPGILDISNLISGYYSYRTVNFYALLAPTMLLSQNTNLMNVDPSTGIVTEEYVTGSRMGALGAEHAGEHIDPALMLKAGGGAKIRIDDKWSMKVEFTGNFGIGADPGSGWEWKVDHLDHYYFRNDGVTPTNGDFYYIGQVGIAYRLGPTNFRSKSKFNRRSYAHRYKKARYKGRSRSRR